MASPIDRVLEDAKRAWPDITLDDAAFAAHAMEKAAGADLARLHAADLYLAFACARGNPIALARFEERHAADIRAIYMQSRGAKPPLDDLMQLVRARLFTGERPRIADYGGLGELKNWVRVTASRVLVDMIRGADPPDGRGRAPADQQNSGDEAFLSVPSPGDDPEMELLKRTYRAEMRQAFEDAARDLSPEERNVLREHYAHGLGIDQIAAMHGIHRATAARRLQGAREAVLRGTRQLLMNRLRLSRSELESALRLIESQMHVTVERVLAE
jgi:RNA polymerase sigma-70 factor (ECF subfamily)